MIHNRYNKYLIERIVLLKETSSTPSRIFKLLPILIVLLGGSLVSFLGIRFPFLLTLLLIAGIGLMVFFKYPRWLIYSLAALIPFQDEISVGALSGARLSPQTLGSTLLIVIMLLRSLLPGIHTRKILRLPYLYPVLAFLLISSSAVAVGPLITGPIQGIWSVYRTVWVAPLIYLGVWVFLKEAKTIHRALACLAAGGTLGAFIAIVQTITGGRFLSGIGGNYRYLGYLNPLPPEVVNSLSGKFIEVLYLSHTNIFRGFGTFYTSNGLGVLLCVTILITWGLFASKTGKIRWIWLGMVCVQILGIIVTFSRSAWAAVIAGGGILLLPVFLLWIKHPSKIPKALIASVVFALIALPLIFSTANVQKRLLTTFTPTKVTEFNWRVAIWAYSGKQILLHPVLGMGTSIIDNTVVQIHDPSTIDAFSTHNLLFDIAYQRGLITLALYILFWIYFFRSGWKLYKNKSADNNPDRKLILGILAGGTAYIISGTGIASMMTENLATLFWFIFGIVISWQHLQDINKTTSPDAG